MRTISFSLEKPKYSAWREARKDWAKTDCQLLSHSPESHHERKRI